MTGAVTTTVSHYNFGDLRIAVKRGDDLFHLHGDHLGSTSLTTDGAGAATASRTYYAYGAERAATGVLQTDRTFTGQKRDTTGLMYYNARYYDPALGTFISPDTIIPDSERVIDYNRFVYARNNPLRHLDESGHTPWDVVDFIFWAISVYEFAHRPSLTTGFWMVADSVSLLPFVPSTGYLRRGKQALRLTDEALQLTQDIVRFVQITTERKLGQMVYDFARIAHKRGAINLLRKFHKIPTEEGGTNWNLVRGLRAELEYAVKFQNDIVEIGRKLEELSEIDFVLKGNVFVDVKNYSWAKDFYQSQYGIDKAIDTFERQARRYLKHTDSVKFVFKKEVPHSVRMALEQLGVIVEVLP